MSRGRGGATPRRILLGATAVVLGVGAHAGAGGAIVATPTVLLVAVLVGVVSSMWVTPRPLSPGRTLAVLGGSQLVLHLALTGHDEHDMAGMAAEGAAGGVAMTVAHVVVTVVLAALVAGADRDLVRAGAALRTSATAAAHDLVRRLTVAVAPPFVLVDRRPIRLPVPVHDPVGVLLARAHSRRGPPSVVLAPLSRATDRPARAPRRKRTP